MTTITQGSGNYNHNVPVSQWHRHYKVKAVHVGDNSGSTSHSIISHFGLENFV